MVGEMNIVYITSEFVTEEQFGGLATYLENITNIMKSNGHQVTVITLSDKSGEMKYQNGIRVIRIRKKESDKLVSDFRRLILQIKNSYQIYLKLKKMNRIEKIDLVQAANYQAVGLFRHYRIPTVVRASSDSAFWRNANNVRFDYEKTMTEKRMTDRLELLCIKLSDGVFAPSKCCADILEKRSGRKIQVLESPYQNCSVQLDDSIYKEELYNKKYLLFNSSLSMLKGTHLGIRTAEKIMEKYPELYMVYAGIDYGLAGSKKSIASILDSQNKKYQGRVKYLHRLPREQLFPVIEHAVACVLPSRIDNLPNSCIEAMALGKIVIGTYGASFEQLIKNKENGLLIKRDSEKALIRAVDYLMNMTEEEYTDMGELAKVTVERLSPDIVYRNMINYYENVIKAYNWKRLMIKKIW